MCGEKTTTAGLKNLFSATRTLYFVWRLGHPTSGLMGSTFFKAKGRGVEIDPEQEDYGYRKHHGEHRSAMPYS